MEVMTVLIPLPRYYNPDASGARLPVEDEKLIQTAEEAAMAFQQDAIYVKFVGGGATVTTRLITKKDRKGLAEGLT